MRLFLNCPSVCVAVAIAAFGAVQSASAEGNGGSVVYRCPGPPVLYTDALSANEAREKNCRTIEGSTNIGLQLNGWHPAFRRSQRRRVPPSQVSGSR